MKFLSLVFLFCVNVAAHAQTVGNRLDIAMQALQKDAQFAHASLGMYVVNTKTGAVVFEKDAQLGLAPASTQKVITSISAFDLLGKDFTYKTLITYDGNIESGTLRGNLYFVASGDPTTGSWRWKQTDMPMIAAQIKNALAAKGITRIEGDIVADMTGWETQATPRGWTWEDIGNYYGAGAAALNWHENQYDLLLKPGKKPGEPVHTIQTKPTLDIKMMVNELSTGAAGSGDQSIIYLPENGNIGFVRGTIPAGTEPFTVKGSIPNAPLAFIQFVESVLKENNISFTGTSLAKKSTGSTRLAGISSPSYDSINYWFLKKSVNLFGEAFVKTMAFTKNGFGSTDSGLAIIRNYWSGKGISKSELKILDGSGLSPANRVTTHALVTVMQYAKKQAWFPSFYYALPEMNGVKMKDGYISGVRSYTGYLTAKDGVEYTFALIVNNFDGSPATVREKMWKLLDILK